jgi:hypothetical protein
MGQQNQVATAVVKQQPMDVGRDLTLSTNKYSTNGLSHSMNGSFYSSSREVDNSDEPTAPASAAAAYESPMETFGICFDK